MDQWVGYLTSPDPEYEVPNIDWIIALFSVTKKDDGSPDPSTKSWAQSMGALKGLIKIYAT